MRRLSLHIIVRVPVQFGPVRGDINEVLPLLTGSPCDTHDLRKVPGLTACWTRQAPKSPFLLLPGVPIELADTGHMEYVFAWESGRKRCVISLGQPKRCRNCLPPRVSPRVGLIGDGVGDEQGRDVRCGCVLAELFIAYCTIRIFLLVPRFLQDNLFDDGPKRAQELWDVS